MAIQFTSAEWDLINGRLQADPERYGLPQRKYGSVLLGSSRSRSPDAWEFLANVCRSFGLLAIQEIMDDLSGLRRRLSGLALPVLVLLALAVALPWLPSTDTMQASSSQSVPAASSTYSPTERVCPAGACDRRA